MLTRFIKLHYQISSPNTIAWHQKSMEKMQRHSKYVDINKQLVKKLKKEKNHETRENCSTAQQSYQMQ